MKAFLSALLLLTGACRSLRPPFSATTEWGTVAAWSPEEAHSISAALSDVAPLVARSLPGLRPKAVDVRGVRTFSAPSGSLPEVTVAGCVRSERGSWIELKNWSTLEDPKGVLAHELVHSWLGPDWDPLPAVVEEGLANLIAAATDPERHARERLGYLIYFASESGDGLHVGPSGEVTYEQAPVILQLDAASSEWRAVLVKPPPTKLASAKLDRDGLPGVREILELEGNRLLSFHKEGQQFVMRGFGFAIVSRTSVDRLFDLCLRAKEEGLKLVPVEWLLAAARIGGTELRDWREAFLELYGEAERAELIRKAFPRVRFFDANGQPIGDGATVVGLGGRFAIPPGATRMAIGGR